MRNWCAEYMDTALVESELERYMLVSAAAARLFNVRVLDMETKDVLALANTLCLRLNGSWRFDGKLLLALLERDEKLSVLEGSDCWRIRLVMSDGSGNDLEIARYNFVEKMKGDLLRTYADLEQEIRGLDMGLFS